MNKKQKNADPSRTASFNIGMLLAIPAIAVSIFYGSMSHEFSLSFIMISFISGFATVLFLFRAVSKRNYSIPLLLIGMVVAAALVVFLYINLAFRDAWHSVR
ncbi:hypothetical protein [Cupriavidus oxalaticus]|jgi:hypothetical protein|uniref:Uncharacterized protein n=1 Tax=Cupriavidus oxalaticus TaxID=96344 RepID=A0A375GHA9_9BURK|nr:hypothetical protein [Cupriavidus oxalaticus]QRQ84176.1 hypothetical protein JTE91_10325 [Cupriavidus oxalaticus]QRQ91735.1 hypothetical protein JTE92_02020 [Cupriavidus oxalaticus]WQD86320.1 hypothetical protein U0036_20120 [Cupriavidus oxalaticus]SPC17877.1 membrane hypothetical protein [Cupriavidus oxalaticus]